jgi:hypothetical protein
MSNNTAVGTVPAGNGPEEEEAQVYDEQNAVGFIRRFTTMFAAYDARGQLLARYPT